MEKKGKSLESIVALIQETLKNSPNTRVLKNHKIQNKDGGKREFDVFIESNVSGYSINIAIECKDYNKPVPVKEIEAFNSKCNSFTKINKKIFISSSGFQTGAITSANNFGIELQVAEKLNADAILNWFPISKISFKILEGGNCVLLTNADNEDELPTSSDLLLGSKLYCNDEEITIDKIITDFLNNERNFINNYSTLMWIKLDENKKSDPFFVSFNVIFHDIYLLNMKNKIYTIKGLNLNLKVMFENTPIQIKEIRQLKNIDGKLQADTLTVQINEEMTSSFVKTPDNNTTVHISGNDGESVQLTVLAIYDQKTKMFNLKK